MQAKDNQLDNLAKLLDQQQQLSGLQEKRIAELESFRGKMFATPDKLVEWSLALAEAQRKAEEHRLQYGHLLS